MFADDLDLLASLQNRLGPFPRPIVEIGGLENPTIAQYQTTIDLMRPLREAFGDQIPTEDIRHAQRARYKHITRPLSFLDPDYVIENPECGGLALEDLPSKYKRSIGTAILLSVLEHVDEPWDAPSYLGDAVKPGGLIVVSVPWCFPEHAGPRDNFRFSPSGLRNIFKWSGMEVLEADWRLRIPADAGVCDPRTLVLHAIESCYLVARVS